MPKVTRAGNQGTGDVNKERSSMRSESSNRCSCRNARYSSSSGSGSSNGSSSSSISSGDISSNSTSCCICSSNCTQRTNETTESKTNDHNSHNIHTTRSSMSLHLERVYRRQTKPYSVFKVPIKCQLSTNSVSIRHQSRISFLKKLMPEKDFANLNCLVQINHKLGLHPKQFDEEFSSIVRQFNDQWERFQQEFIELSREEKAKRLKEDPSLQLQLVQLTKYLERYQILRLRAKYPMIQEENLLVHLRQQHHLPSLMKTLDQKVKMLKQMDESAKRNKTDQHTTPLSSDSDDHLCIICCDESNKVTYPCGHSCCCSACSKNLKHCPLCRASITGNVSISTNTNNNMNETESRRTTAAVISSAT